MIFARQGDQNIEKESERLDTFGLVSFTTDSVHKKSPKSPNVLNLAVEPQSQLNMWGGRV